MRLIREAPDFTLQLAVTGMHLNPAFGETQRDIEEDGFKIDARVTSLQDGDTASAVIKSIGHGVIGFADCLSELTPDIVMVLGDRYEILAAVQAALIAKIPVAHLAGGDTSEGAFDESIRHAISKMSHLHFVTNAESARRVRQMGENPTHVHHVGSTGLDYIRRTEYLERSDVLARIGIEPYARQLLVTYHPVTLDPVSSLRHGEELLAALERVDAATGIIITGPNADTEGRALTTAMTAFAAKRPNAVFRESLGQMLYVNALKQADAVVGNSSSGLYEAPSFGIPTVNIGDRQRGRLKADSVLDCLPERDRIYECIQTALAGDYRNTINPYGAGNASENILDVLRTVGDPQSLIQKTFCDV
jgi:UDP-hydrolysing UDP-N-acetyl-D-glucosamine 2-epimerase